MKTGIILSTLTVYINEVPFDAMTETDANCSIRVLLLIEIGRSSYIATDPSGLWKITETK